MARESIAQAATRREVGTGGGGGGNSVWDLAGGTMSERKQILKINGGWVPGATGKLIIQ